MNQFVPCSKSQLQIVEQNERIIENRLKKIIKCRGYYDRLQNQLPNLYQNKEIYPCKECSAVYKSQKQLSGHMNAHRQKQRDGKNQKNQHKKQENICINNNKQKKIKKVHRIKSKNNSQKCFD